MATINAGFTKTEARRASWRPRSDSRFSLADSESGTAAIRPAWATMGKPGRSTTDSRFDPIVCSQAASNRSDACSDSAAIRVFRRITVEARAKPKAGLSGGEVECVAECRPAIPVRQATWSRPLEIEACDRRIARAQSGRCVYSSEFPIGRLRRFVSGPIGWRGLAAATSDDAQGSAAEQQDEEPAAECGDADGEQVRREAGADAQLAARTYVSRPCGGNQHTATCSARTDSGLSVRPLEWRWAERSPTARPERYPAARRFVRRRGRSGRGSHRNLLRRSW